MSVRRSQRDRQTPVLVQQGQCLLNDPAAGGHLVAGAAAWDVASDPPTSEFVVDPRVVVALVCDQGRDLLAWSAWASSQRPYSVEQFCQHEVVVDVGRGLHDREW